MKIFRDVALFHLRCKILTRNIFSKHQCYKPSGFKKQ